VTTIEERVAYVEGRLAEQSEMFVDLRTGLSNLAGRVDQLEQSMNRRFDQVDARFVQMDARLVQMDARLVQIDDRFVQIDTHFRWMVGIQITTAVTVIAALIGALAVR